MSEKISLDSSAIHYENKEYTSIIMLPLHRSVLLHGRRYFE